MANQGTIRNPTISKDSGQGFSASGKTPVTGTFTGTGQSSTFIPIAGRSFNVVILGTATVQLERYLDSSTGWQPVTKNGVVYALDDSASEQFKEDEVGVQYRLNCTSWTSNTAYRISQ